MLITTALFASTTFYLANKNPRTVIAPTVEPLSSTPTPLATPVPTENMGAWSSAEVFGLTFQHPTGWHVASFWPNRDDEEITLVVNPTPVDNAPRGGPMGKFTIELYTDKDDIEKLTVESGKYHTPDNFTDIQAETLQSDGGTLNFFSGKIAGDYMQGTRSQNYILTLHKWPSNPSAFLALNGSCVVCDSDVDVQQFRQLMLSFKLTP